MLDRDGLIELLLGWLDRYPIVSIEDPLAEDDRDGWIAFTQRGGGAGADRRRRLSDDERSASRRRCASGCVQRGVDQAEPGWNRHRSAGRTARRGSARASARSFRRARERRRTPRSSILPSAGAQGSSRWDRSRAASERQSGTKPCGSRRPWVRAPVMPGGAPSRGAPTDGSWVTTAPRLIESKAGVTR